MNAAVRTAQTGALLSRACIAMVNGDRVGATELFTEDVSIVAPHLEVSSRQELVERFTDWQDALSNVTTAIFGLCLDDDTASVDWQVSADHCGALFMDEDELFEATGQRLHMAGHAVVGIRRGRIHSVTFWESAPTLLAQLRSAR